MNDRAPSFDAPAVTELTIWTKTPCPQCIGAKLQFKSKHLVPFERAIAAPENADDFAALRAAGVAQAPIIQFPEVRDGDEVLFAARTTTGNQVDLIDAYADAERTLASRRELVAA
jgi:hypothetical protein